MKTKRLFQTGLCLCLFLLTGFLQAQTSAFEWLKGAGSSGADSGRAITVYNSKVYVTGYFSGTATFGAGTANSINLTSAGGKDIFVSRYDLSGNFEAVTQLGSAGNDEGLAIIACNKYHSLNVYLMIGGFYNGNILVMSIGSLLFTNGSSQTAPGSFPGTGAATGFAYDGNGRLDVSGWYTGGSVTFGSTTLTSSYTSSFVAQTSDISASPVTYGAAIGTDQTTETGDNEAMAITAVTLGGTKKLYITGFFKGNVNFHSSSTTMTASGTRDVYVAGITSTNGGLAWVSGEQNYGGGSTTESGSAAQQDQQKDIGWGIVADANGVYITGRANSSPVFHGASSNLTISQTGTMGFLVKYDYSSNVLNNPVWQSKVVPISGGSPVWSRGIALDNNSNLYITGEAYSDCKLVDNSGTSFNFHTTTSGAWGGGFIACVTTSGTGVWGDKMSWAGHTTGCAITYFSCDLYVAGTVGSVSPSTTFGNVPYTPGYTNTDEIFVGKLEPDLHITHGGYVCSATGSATLTLVASSATAGGYSWSGSNGFSSSSASTSDAVSGYGTYTYTVTTTSGTCTGMTGIVSYTVTPTATVTAAAVPDYSNLCYADGPSTFQLNTSPVTGTTYSWSPGTLLSCTSCPSPTVTPTALGTFNYTVTVTDPCGGQSTSQVVVFLTNSGCRLNGHQQGTGIATFNIFPNPGTGAFSIETPDEGVKTIVVTDITGRVILQMQSDAKTIPLDLQNESVGTYFVQVTSESGRQVQQLIKE